ncbi:MAG: deoxyguanosinetriphosphate triphosphohydrolase [Sulfurovum sp.]|nr:deoxyguanosinetriphosphate triphosphohydrolase [Sulfurovum sp.]
MKEDKIKNLLSKKRFHSQNDFHEDNNEDMYRTSFHRDYDRVIFSNSFRRLSKKTQVHPLSKNDHVHNRLTHSLEVASVGRSLGISAGEFLKKKDDSINPYDVGYIVQTACLAHDIGNPPFGHAGEEVIKEWFAKNKEKDFLGELNSEELNDFLHLDGNAQSFRIVTQLENYIKKGGLKLTFASLGTLVKYPHTSDKCAEISKSKFNFFKSEEVFAKKLFEELGLYEEENFIRHPLSYLMEAADDICYGLLDLQDAIELKIITLEDTREIFNLLCGENDVKNTLDDSEYSDVNKISKLVAWSINNLTIEVIKIFESNFDELSSVQQPEDISSLIERMEQGNLKNGIQKAKELAEEKIFKEQRKIELELGAYNIIETLLDNIIRATYQLHKNKNKLSFRNMRVLDLMGTDRPKDDDTLYNKYQSVTDYIIGMTDSYAKHIAHQLNGMGY